jgi:hypothetical protein
MRWGNTLSVLAKQITLSPLDGEFTVSRKTPFLFACGLLGATILSSNPVQAATLSTYNLTGTNSTAASFMVAGTPGALGAPTLTVSAFDNCTNVLIDESCTDSAVGRNVSGMGVDAVSNAVVGDGEILRLFFDQMVRVVNVTFAGITSPDRFNLAIDTIVRVTDGDPANTNPVTVTLANNPFSLTEVQRSGFYFDFSKGTYKLQSIDIEYGADVVPTPALLPGLVGLGVGALRRRQRQLKQVEA